MINIQNIVLEEINKYFGTQVLSEGLFEADNEGEGNVKHSGNKPKSDKQKEVERKIEKYKEREGEDATTNNAESVIRFLKHECINASKVLERATGLDPTSAASEASKYASGEWPVTENLVNTVNEIKAELNS